jgi:hypothetical protein
VLAAQQSTNRIALEKVKFEQMVALQPNTTTRSSTELKLSQVTEKLKSLPAPTPEAITAVDLATTAASSDATELILEAEAPVAMMAMMATEPTDTLARAAATTTASTTLTTTPTAKQSTTKQVIQPTAITPLTADQLVAGAIQKINAGEYSEALVSLQKAEQVIDEANLTRTLEKTYNITQ